MSGYRTEIVGNELILHPPSTAGAASGALKAEQLDALIAELMVVRQQMTPEPQPAEPTLAVVANGRRLRLEMSTHPVPSVFELTSAEVEEFLQALMEHRTAMHPAIPNADPPAGTKFVARSCRRWWIEAQPAAGQVVLALQHPGLGWLWLSLSSDNVKTILRQFAGALAKIEPD